jgi:hypothetical protein
VAPLGGGEEKRGREIIQKIKIKISVDGNTQNIIASENITLT